MSKVALFGVLLSLSVAGCTRYPIQQESRIPAESVLNGLQCELARYVAKHPKAPFVTGNWVIEGSLDLQLADETGFGGEIGAKNILAYAGAPTIDLGFGGTVSEKQTKTAKVDFTLKFDPKRRQCIENEEGVFGIVRVVDGKKYFDDKAVVNNIGLESWLSSLDRVHPAGLRYTPGKYTYGLTFGVSSKVTAEGSIGLVAIPVALSLNTYKKRDDVQVLQVEIAPQGKPPVTRIEIVSKTDKDKQGPAIQGIVPDTTTRTMIVPVVPSVRSTVQQDLRQNRRDLFLD